MAEELVPFRPQGEVEPAEEVVDAEIVVDYDDIRWVQWWDDARYTTNFKMQVDDTWYRRVDRADWDQLNALLGGIADLVRRTSTRGPRTATAAERAAEGSGSPRKPR